MADVSVTASAVAAGSGCVTETGTAGATITAGQTVYKDSTDGDALKLADSNASSATATVVGIALHGALDGQPLTFAKDGRVTFNAALTAGEIYVQSATAGGIAPCDDLTTGWRATILGVAMSTTSLNMKLYNSDTAQ